MPPTFESNYRMSEQELDQLLRPRPSATGDERNLGNITQFYQGRCVFVTGATGFVGRLLVEKLLRACTGIDRVFMLVRAKRGKSARERVREITNSIVFDGLRQAGVNLDEKLVPIEGSLTEHGYGLTQDQLEVLAQNVSVIFHSAASVNFQEPLRDALLTNLVGALNSIQLAKQLPKLVALVQVSTAYSNCTQQTEVCEHIYPPPIEPQVMVELIELLDRDTMEQIKPHLIGSYPNTYTFTKNLAESMCLRNADQVPIVVCRPSVVVSTWREPVAGFVDNINGSNGINYGPASGLSVVMQADNSVVLDYVPVDVVVNTIIALGWFCAKFHESKRRRFELPPITPPAADSKQDLPDATKHAAEQQLQPAELNDKFRCFYETKLNELRRKQLSAELAEVPVFHVTSGVENPIKFGVFKDKMIANANKYPTLQLYRLPRMTYVRSKQVFMISRFFQNTLVAKFYDLIHRFGLFKPEVHDKNDPIVKKSLAFRSERIDQFGQTIAFFLNRHWDFRPENRHSLIDQFMSQEDRYLFNCDMRYLNWDEYCKIYSLGIRKFLLKEPYDTLQRARARMGKIKACTLVLRLALFVAIIYCFFVILN